MGKMVMTISNANLFIVAAPSGAGKSSLINALLQRTQEGHLFNPAQLSVSHTTRLPRDGEVNGEHYHYVDVEQFTKMIESGAFYEYAQVFENYYGTSKVAISIKLAQGIDVFLDIDWQGARQVKRVNPDVVSIFILPPSKEELNTRLVSRGKDSDSVIESRMQQAQQEMSHYNEFDYVIVNDNFTHALDQLISIVKANSLGLKQQQLRHKGLLASLLK
jgi:guanylate kinase